MFALRLLTAAALLVAFVSALWFLDRRGFACVAAGVVVAGGYEWGRLQSLVPGRSLAFGIFAGLAMLALLEVSGAAPWICVTAAAFWLVGAPMLLRRGSVLRTRPAAQGLAILVPAGIALASLSREHVLMVLGLVWIADTAAYLAGRAFGRHKLAPSISPGKTWEGVAGAVVGVGAYAIIWAMLDPALAGRVRGSGWAAYLAAAALLCAVSVLGDLYESAAKRQAGVKDSGRLLPGHGGVLDRIDSATAALPVAVALLWGAGIA